MKGLSLLGVAWLAAAACSERMPPAAPPVVVDTATASVPVPTSAGSTSQSPSANDAPVPQGRGVRLAGVARNAKGGAVLIADNRQAVYISGLDTWPAALLDQRVVVTGALARERYLPEATQDASGARTAGTSGDKQLVLRDANWSREDGNGPSGGAFSAGAGAACDADDQCALTGDGSVCRRVESTGASAHRPSVDDAHAPYCECNASANKCVRRVAAPVSCSHKRDCWHGVKAGRLVPLKSSTPRKLPFKPCIDGEIDAVCANGVCRLVAYDC